MVVIPAALSVESRCEAEESNSCRAKMTEPLQFLLDRVSTPIGDMVIAADCKGNLRAALFTANEEVVRRQLRLHYGERGFSLEAAINPHSLSEAIAQYFAGDLDVIDTLRVETGGTPFQ